MTAVSGAVFSPASSASPPMPLPAPHSDDWPHGGADSCHPPPPPRRERLDFSSAPRPSPFLLRSSALFPALPQCERKTAPVPPSAGPTAPPTLRRGSAALLSRGLSLPSAALCGVALFAQC